MIFQKEVLLPQFKRGFHIITDYLLDNLDEISKINKGVLHIFLQHTSAGIMINENADPSVRVDFENFFSRLIPDGTSYLTHISEGEDDMPAHIKAALTGSGITVPISGGHLNLGTWQGIYLCEFRNFGGRRKIILTAYGD